MDIFINESSNLSTYFLEPALTSNTLWLNNNATDPVYNFCDARAKDEFNCSIEDFVLYNRGPKQMPLFTALLVTIFFVVIFVTGVIGNLIVCLVIVRHDSMHTATNYYLFSLAVSDLIFLLFGLPYDLSLYWHQYPYNLGLGFCKIRALISEASTYVSVLTIVAFSMERFLAICHPLHLYTMSGLQRAVRIIAALWLISFLSAVPFAVFSGIDYLHYPPTKEIVLDSAFCAMLENPDNFPLWELSTCLFFVVPMIVMIVLYGRMGLRIRSRTKHSAQLGVQHASMHNETRQSQSRKAIIRMLAAVVITFFVCWAPFHAQRLLYLYARDWQHFNLVNTWLFSVAGWLYYVSCTINPILYNVMSHRYRVAFKETLCGRKRSSNYSNGFSRDQSSFRETTVAASGGNYENAKLLRAQSVITTKHRYKDRIHTNSLRWTDRSRHQSFKSDALIKRTPTTNSNPSDVVVVIGNNINGRPKCYTTSSSVPATTTTITLNDNECNNLPTTEPNNNGSTKHETSI